jgi:hypothetical protein
MRTTIDVLGAAKELMGGIATFDVHHSLTLPQQTFSQLSPLCVCSRTSRPDEGALPEASKERGAGCRSGPAGHAPATSEARRTSPGENPGCEERRNAAGRPKILRGAVSKRRHFKISIAVLHRPAPLDRGESLKQTLAGRTRRGCRVCCLDKSTFVIRGLNTVHGGAYGISRALAAGPAAVAVQRMG